MPPQTFFEADAEAGYWISRDEVRPLGVRVVDDALGALVDAGLEPAAGQPQEGFADVDGARPEGRAHQTYERETGDTAHGPLRLPRDARKGEFAPHVTSQTSLLSTSPPGRAGGLCRA
ncbi:MAG: hypothetical protein KIS90_09545 [Phenylobacterium sp.]|nr:hypothetical protein [Phenylobacterium sp.]